MPRRGSRSRAFLPMTDGYCPMTMVDSLQKTEFSTQATELCVRLPVSVGAAGLARELSALVPELVFRDVLTRGGWYRLGGVVDAAGQRIADDLSAWGETELARCGEEMHVMYDAHVGKGLKATRLIGRTHYLVASTGPEAADFLQVEVEELQEVLSHTLFDEHEPGTLEEMFEAPEAAYPGADAPVALPFFAFRRVTNVADLLKRIARQKPEPQNIHRFFDAWQASSASNVTLFSNHWVLAVREYLDRYHQSIQQATPVAALNGSPPKFSGSYGAKGLALYESLQRFDRQVGYPMAWFFHMLTTKSVPQAVAHAVIDDVQSGFSYLPERDVAVLKRWLYRPFAF